MSDLSLKIHQSVALFVCFKEKFFYNPPNNTSLLTGSDQEKALIKALQKSFPDADFVFCALHMEVTSLFMAKNALFIVIGSKLIYAQNILIWFFGFKYTIDGAWRKM